MRDDNIENNSNAVEIYSEKDNFKDEKKFDSDIKNGKFDLSTFKRLMIGDFLSNSQIIETGKIGKFKISDVKMAMENPKYGWRILQDASAELMHISPHYYRLNNMYADMSLFCWWIDLYGVKPNANQATIKSQYLKLSERLEMMNIKHEFSKIMRCLPYQDIYCGLVVENDTDFFIQKIDFKICKLFQIQDGLYNFKIDLTKIKASEIMAYPDYVRDAYADFIENGLLDTGKWYIPPSDKQICIKMNSQWTYPYPIMINLIKDVLDLDIYKNLKLQSARTDNYKAILVQVPIDESRVDSPLISPNMIATFSEINRESMNDDIGMIHTLGSKGEAISFKDSSNTRNNVSDAVDEIYNASGISGELFNSSGNATSMTLSVENNAGIIYSVYRQMERWMNRYIKLKKYNRSSFKFSFYLLDITTFNRDSVSKRYKEAASMGACIDRWLASLDMTPARTLGAYAANEYIFNFHNNLIPLQSSYNSSAAIQASESSGRPTVEETGQALSDEGERTRDLGKNS